MTKMEYANKVAELVNGEVRMIEKANGVVLTGITSKDGDVRPTVYIEDMYGKDDVETAADKIRQIYETNITLPCDISFIQDYNKVKDKLVARLYNSKTKAEVFRSAAAYGFEDLIIVPYIQFSDNASAKVTRQLANTWEVSDEDILMDAMKNVDYEITPMFDMLKNMNVPVEGLEYETEMYIVTNKAKSFGAIGVLLADDELKDIFPEGYIVLPSSVHEVIVISKNYKNYLLTNIIRDVNATEVDEIEVLSDHEYIFEEF